jgi:methionyl-tRNA formyltransferase
VRVVFFGTPEFAVPTLEALLASRHRVEAVVTQPDRPRGRGQKLAAPPVKQLAARQGLPVLQPERLRDEAFLEQMRRLAPDLGVVAAYGKILPVTLLAIPARGMLNVHASILPRWRGASPVQHAVMAGDAETGVTIMRVVEALDAGAMLARASRPIGPEETAGEVEAALASMGGALLARTLDALEKGPVPEEPQDEALATYAPRLTRQDGAIDWGQPAGTLHDRIRGLHPWPGAFTFLGGQRLLVRAARVAQPGDVETGAFPGTVVHAGGDRLVVAAGEGSALCLHEVQLEGRRAMSARELLAGRLVREGTRFDEGAAAAP